MTENPVLDRQKPLEGEVIEPSPVGRPKAYRPEWCDIVMECGERGESVVEMALACNVSRETLYATAENVLEFSDAFTRARQASIAWLERKGRESFDKKVFQSRPWEVLIKSRDHQTYSERHQVTGADGGGIQVVVNHEDKMLCEK